MAFLSAKSSVVRRLAVLMMARRWHRKRLASLKLRHKLAIPFGALALMAATCGLAGLAVMNRTSQSVAILSDVTSPLLMESIALVNIAHQMRSAFEDGTSGTEVVLSALPRLDGEGRLRIERMQQLARVAGITDDFDRVSKHQQEFAKTLEVMALAHDRKRVAEAKLAVQADQTKDVFTSIREALRLISSSMEARIIENEEAAKVQLQKGVATTDGLGALFEETVGDFFIALQNSYKLQRTTTRLYDLAQESTLTATALKISNVENETRELFKAFSSLQRKIAARLQRPEHRPALSMLNEALVKAQTLFLGPQGVLFHRRETWAAWTEVVGGGRVLDEIETRYLAILTEIETKVRLRNDEAKSTAGSAITFGQALILGLIVAAGLLALAAGAFLHRHIMAPISALTAHVSGMGETWTLREVTDKSALLSRDELGKLTHAFNHMIRKLHESQRQLVARSEAEISKQVERLGAALKNMSQGLCMFDREHRLVLANEQYAKIYDVPADRIRPGMSLREIVEQRIAAGSYCGDPVSHVDTYLARNTETTRSDSVIELNNGRSIHIIKEPMSNGGWVATHEDVTERRQSEAKLAHMARHDALTGLPNRVLFREKLEDALTRVARGESIAIHYLDLDQFKAVNDTLGHPIGDALLRSVTDRLLDCIREHDLIARLGGDEFAIIQIVDDAASDSTALATRIIEAISRPYDLDGHQVLIGTSVGIAIAPEDGHQPDDLLKHADLALYRAKADGRGTYRFFKPEMDTFMQARRKMELELRKALIKNEFVLFYQPLVELSSGRITGFEALLRWNHPERGLVQPNDFIPALEETGLIVGVGEWALHEACQQAQLWPADIKVAVNLSPVQFTSPNLVRAVTVALQATGLAPIRLELEITETVLLQDTEATLTTLHKLKELGVTIAMDDFGTGYSSLSYLRSFPFDRIKIDRSFIRDISESSDATAIVRAVASLGITLGMATTAEGVETQEQLDLLRGEGCTDVQGYFFSAPRPAEEIASLLPKAAATGTLAA